MILSGIHFKRQNTYDLRYSQAFWSSLTISLKNKIIITVNKSDMINYIFQRLEYKKELTVCLSFSLSLSFFLYLKLEPFR